MNPVLLCSNLDTIPGVTFDQVTPIQAGHGVNTIQTDKQHVAVTNPTGNSHTVESVITDGILDPGSGNITTVSTKVTCGTSGPFDPVPVVCEDLVVDDISKNCRIRFGMQADTITIIRRNDVVFNLEIRCGQVSVLCQNIDTITVSRDHIAVDHDSTFFTHNGINNRTTDTGVIFTMEVNPVGSVIRNYVVGNLGPVNNG